MIEAVLFDLDGTLAVYRKSYVDFMRRIAADWQILDESDPFFTTYSRAILAEGPVSFQSAIEQALLASGRSPGEDAAEKCHAAVADYASGVELLPWAMDLIERYSQLPKAIVSNGPCDMQRATIQKLNLYSRVDEIVISGDPNVGVRKPNPAIFRRACKRLRVEPSSVLMIGDNATTDIEGARNAGLQAVLVSDLISAFELQSS